MNHKKELRNFKVHYFLQRCESATIFSISNDIYDFISLQLMTATNNINRLTSSYKSIYVSSLDATYSQFTSALNILTSNEPELATKSAFKDSVVSVYDAYNDSRYKIADFFKVKTSFESTQGTVDEIIDSLMKIEKLYKTSTYGTIEKCVSMNQNALTYVLNMALNNINFCGVSQGHQISLEFFQNANLIMQNFKNAFNTQVVMPLSDCAYTEIASDCAENFVSKNLTSKILC